MANYILLSGWIIDEGKWCLCRFSGSNKRFPVMTEMIGGGFQSCSGFGFFNFLVPSYSSYSSSRHSIPLLKN